MVRRRAILVRVDTAWLRWPCAQRDQLNSLLQHRQPPSTNLLVFEDDRGHQLGRVSPTYISIHRLFAQIHRLVQFIRTCLRMLSGQLCSGHDVLHCQCAKRFHHDREARRLRQKVQTTDSMLFAACEYFHNVRHVLASHCSLLLLPNYHIGRATRRQHCSL